jgi:hypothetical protein
MPALRVLGGHGQQQHQQQRSCCPYLAGDDLRRVSRLVIVGRLAQVALWIPSCLVLLLLLLHGPTAAAPDNWDDHWDDTIGDKCHRRGYRHIQTMVVVWSFAILSATTILFSILLETFM